MLRFRNLVSVGLLFGGVAIAASVTYTSTADFRDNDDVSAASDPTSACSASGWTGSTTTCNTSYSSNRININTSDAAATLDEAYGNNNGGDDTWRRGKTYLTGGAPSGYWWIDANSDGWQDDWIIHLNKASGSDRFTGTDSCLGANDTNSVSVSTWYGSTWDHVSGNQGDTEHAGLSKEFRAGTYFIELGGGGRSNSDREATLTQTAGSFTLFPSTPNSAIDFRELWLLTGAAHSGETSMGADYTITLDYANNANDTVIKARVKNDATGSRNNAGSCADAADSNCTVNGVQGAGTTKWAIRVANSGVQYTSKCTKLHDGTGGGYLDEIRILALPSDDLQQITISWPEKPAACDIDATNDSDCDAYAWLYGPLALAMEVGEATYETMFEFRARYQADSDNIAAGDPALFYELDLNYTKNNGDVRVNARCGDVAGSWNSETYDDFGANGYRPSGTSGTDTLEIRRSAATTPSKACEGEYANYYVDLVLEEEGTTPYVNNVDIRYALDVDGDGYGAEAINWTDAATTDVAVDCNDAASDVYPTKTIVVADLADGQDSNCTGGATETSDECPNDADLDGYGVSGLSDPITITTHWKEASSVGASNSCADYDEGGPLVGSISDSMNDCDDGDDTVSPGASVTLTDVDDGVDRNCDGQDECLSDDDGDLYPDDRVNGLPAGVDNDDIVPDVDGDLICTTGAGVTGDALIDSGDCNDTAADIYPGNVVALEDVDDGVDEDCDSEDECFDDDDNDGYPDDGGDYAITAADIIANDAGLDCDDSGSDGVVGKANQGSPDCNDTVADIYTGNVLAVEDVDDGVDEDCDQLDECYDDDDNDGYPDDNGDYAITAADIIDNDSGLNCDDSSTDGIVGEANEASPDCADTVADIYKGNVVVVADVDDGVDEDCDQLDECYDDDDNDNYPDDLVNGTAGFQDADIIDNDSGLDCDSGTTDGVTGSANQGSPDCNDAAADIYPGNPLALEDVDDGVDEDCDTLDECFDDDDNDGYPDDNGDYAITAADITDNDSGLNCDDSSTDGIVGNANQASPDCADTVADIYFGNVLVLADVDDGVDEDCDTFDECFDDDDNDGYPDDNGDYAITAADILDNDSGLNCDDSSTDGIVGNANQSSPDCADTVADIYFGNTVVLGDVDDGVDEDCDTFDECFDDDDNDGYPDDNGDYAITAADITDNDSGLNCDDSSTDGIVGNANQASPDCADTVADIYFGNVLVLADVDDGVDEDCDTFDECFDDDDNDGYPDDNGDYAITAADIIDNDSGLNCDDSSTDGVVGNANQASPDCADTVADIYFGNVLVTADVDDGVDEDCDQLDECFDDDDNDGYPDDNGDYAITAADIIDNDSGLDCDDSSTDGIVGSANQSSPDCADTVADIYFGNVVVLADVDDGVDEDCDQLDECYDDDDNDGYPDAGGDYAITKADITDNDSGLNCDDSSTDGIVGEANEAKPDCDDAVAATNPDATDTPVDGVDNNCTINSTGTASDTCYLDADDDNYGVTTTAEESDHATEITAAAMAYGTNVCADYDNTPGDGVELSSVTTDCDDTQADIYPGNVLAVQDVGDGVDEDCDSLDECYEDGDDDGYADDGGDGFDATDIIDNDSGLDCDDSSSDGIAGAAALADCDDDDEDIHPGYALTLQDVDDGFDRDCDEKDECFSDADDDGYPGDQDGDYAITAADVVANDSGLNCDDSSSDGIVGAGNEDEPDCEDGDASVNPGADEEANPELFAGNGIDDDCDGGGVYPPDHPLGPGQTSDYLDDDGDGVRHPNSGDDITDDDDTEYDQDNDGLTDYDELVILGQSAGGGCADPNDPDSDGDGIDDAEEVALAGEGRTRADITNPGVSAGASLNQFGTYTGVVSSVLNTDKTSGGTDDATKDVCDTDDDGDGILTEDEIGAAAAYSDYPGCKDGHPDTTNCSWSGDEADVDGDGTKNHIDMDSDGDGFDDDEEGEANTDLASVNDPDDLPDFLDDDSEGDGVADGLEVDGDSDDDDVDDRLDEDDDGDGVRTYDEDVDYFGATDKSATGFAMPKIASTMCAVATTPVDTDDDFSAAWDSSADPDDWDGDPTNNDNDRDGTPDYRDPNDDADLVDTKEEDQDWFGDDDGVADATAFGALGDDDWNPGSTPSGGADDSDEDPGNNDNDHDGIPDYADPDDDNDGFASCEEGDATTDSDGDGIPDYLDPDADGDSVSDAGELHVDSNGTDEYDRLDGDDDGDGITTRAEHVDALDYDQVRIDHSDGAATDPQDGDGDGTPNYLDPDSDGDGVPDSDEHGGDGSDPVNTDAKYWLYEDGILRLSTNGSTGTNPDKIGDDAPDFLDWDSDADGVDDEHEVEQDFDEDDLDDRVDADDDDDGVATVFEDWDFFGDDDAAALDDAEDANPALPYAANGDDDNADPRDNDNDQDGSADYLDADDDADEVETANEDPTETGDPRDSDTDGDGIPDYLDPDDDADTVFTADEDSASPGDPLGTNTDASLTAGDSLPDYLDDDDDADAVPTAVENAYVAGDADGLPNHLDQDADDDGFGDEHEYNYGQDHAEAFGIDRDGDGLPDFVDDDSDADNVADADEFPDQDDLLAGGKDHDKDGVEDRIDPDDDDDSIPTKCEDYDSSSDTADLEKANACDEDDPFGSVPTHGDGDPTDEDRDDDGTADYLDDDDDGDGVPTADEDHDGSGDPRDDNQDGLVVHDSGDLDQIIVLTDELPDYLDSDDDNDGVETVDEASVADPDDPTEFDLDLDGHPNYLDGDDDGDGYPTAVEGDDAWKWLTALEGDWAEIAASDPLEIDYDADGLADFLDADDDDDAVPTWYERVAEQNHPENQGGFYGFHRAPDSDGDQHPDGEEWLNWLDHDPALTDCESPYDGTLDRFQWDIKKGDWETIPSYYPNPVLTAYPIDPLFAEWGDGVGWSCTYADGALENLGDVLDMELINLTLGTFDDCAEQTGTSPDVPWDRDCDGDPNFADDDDDGDGCQTLSEDAYGHDNGEIIPPSPTNANFPMTPIAPGDGVPHYLDRDSDNDGMSDYFETLGGANNDKVCFSLNADADGDLLFDWLDGNNAGAAADADGDGILQQDEDLIGSETSGLDTDGDGIVDGADSDLDGVADNLEIGPNPQNPLDTDQDGTPDIMDPDDDGDGIPTLDEIGVVDSCGVDETFGFGVGTTNVFATQFLWGWYCYDADGEPGAMLAFANTDVDAGGVYPTHPDDLPDYLDADDDGDGVPTADEDRNGNGDWTDDDHDGDGVVDYLDPNDFDGLLADADGDGLTNEVEEQLGTNPYLTDTDGDGVPDGAEVGDSDAPADSDDDTVIDALDSDDDGDGVPTEDEGTSDLDGDGTPNYLDADSDGDGVLDADETDSGETFVDVDCDGVDDAFDEDTTFGPCIPEPPVETGVAVKPRPCEGCTSGRPAEGALALLALLASVRRRKIAPVHIVGRGALPPV